MHLDQDDLAFLARFAKQPDGERLLQLFESELHAVDVKLRKSVGEETFRLQGRAQQLEDCVKWISGRSGFVHRQPAPNRELRQVSNP
jgi:hypothetical protein